MNISVGNLVPIGTIMRAYCAMLSTALTGRGWNSEIPEVQRWNGVRHENVRTDIVQADPIYNYGPETAWHHLWAI